MRAKFCSYQSERKPLRAAGASMMDASLDLGPLNQQSVMFEESFEANPELEKESELLELINQVQMFQIAGSRVNQSLMNRKQKPVFNLSF